MGQGESIDYSRQYLTIVARTATSFTLYTSSAYTWQYSMDEGATWATMVRQTKYNIPAGGRMMLKGNGSNYDIYPSSWDGTFDVEGNLLSLCYGDNFIGQTTIPSGMDFYTKFKDSGVVDASNLIMPSVLSDWCFQEMFMYCEALVAAPTLPAMTLTEWCYYEMFYDCTSLNHIECYAINHSASNCTYNWLYGVAATGTFIQNYGASWSRGASAIPTGWTIETASHTLYELTNHTLNGTSASVITTSVNVTGGKWLGISLDMTLNGFGEDEDISFIDSGLLHLNLYNDGEYHDIYGDAINAALYFGDEATVGMRVRLEVQAQVNMSGNIELLARSALTTDGSEPTELGEWMMLSGADITGTQSITIGSVGAQATITEFKVFETI